MIQRHWHSLGRVTLAGSVLGRVALLVAGLGGCAAAGAQASPGWTQVFADVRPALYLQATYPDAAGQPRRLEFWRDAAGRVVRRTGDRAELRLTPAPDGEDQYQLRNLPGRTAYDVHRTNLYRLGILTDRWSVQHLLDRPTAAPTLTDLHRTERTAAGPCAWVHLRAAEQQLDICWSARLGVPLRLRAGTRTLLTVQRVQTSGVQLPAATLPTGWHEFDADEDLAPD